MSALEEQMLFQMRAVGIPAPQREYRFCERRWKFDFAWPEILLYLEIEGGTWSVTPGRHSRGAGMRNDAVKYNQASLAGWTGLRATTDMVKDGTALAAVEQAFKAMAA